jgi:hypothetical protein
MSWEIEKRIDPKEVINSRIIGDVEVRTISLETAIEVFKATLEDNMRSHEQALVRSGHDLGASLADLADRG